MKGRGSGKRKRIRGREFEEGSLFALPPFPHHSSVFSPNFLSPPPPLLLYTPATQATKRLESQNIICFFAPFPQITQMVFHNYILCNEDVPIIYDAELLSRTLTCKSIWQNAIPKTCNGGYQSQVSVHC